MKPLRVRRMLRCLTRRADYLRDIAIPRYAGAQRSSFMREEESALRWALEQLGPVVVESVEQGPCIASDGTECSCSRCRGVEEQPA